jgi:hypothetical protein
MRTFTQAVIQNATASCDVFNLFLWWWRQQIIRIIHFYELKLKPDFLRLLCYVSIMCSSFACGLQLFQVFKFLNTHSKILEKCLPFIFQTSKLNAKLSFLFACSRHIMNPIFSFKGAAGGGGLPGCSPLKAPQQKFKKKDRFCRYHYIKSFPCYPLQPKSTTEIGWWLVH